jgi:hypothetical protein
MDRLFNAGDHCPLEAQGLTGSESPGRRIADDCKGDQAFVHSDVTGSVRVDADLEIRATQSDSNCVVYLQFEWRPVVGNNLPFWDAIR